MILNVNDRKLRYSTLKNKGGEKQMIIDEIKKLIQKGEKINVEFKESKNALSKNVFDTVRSFNNRSVDIFYLA